LAPDANRATPSLGLFAGRLVFLAPMIFGVSILVE
jgi:hypothetical protein